MEKILLAVFIILFIWNIIIIIVQNKKYRKDLPEKIKVFNLGSSHGYHAYNYTNNKNGVNLAGRSQTFYYDKIMLDYAYDKIEKGAVCFLLFSYFSFAGKERWQRDDLIKYYRILKLNDFKGKEKVECFIYKYLPLIWSIRKKIRRKFFKIKEISDEQRIKGHVKKLENQVNKEYNLKILKDILRKCKSKDMKVIFVTTPFTKYYNSFFSEELLNEKFYKIIQKLCQEYNIRYFDFSHEYRIFNEKEHLKDYDHLSKEGSKVFMKELKERLKIENIEI